MYICEQQQKLWRCGLNGMTKQELSRKNAPQCYVVYSALRNVSFFFFKKKTPTAIKVEDIFNISFCCTTSLITDYKYTYVAINGL